MKETCEFRVEESFANRLFQPSEGRRLGDSVRQVEISTSDPRFEQIGVLQAQLRKDVREPFFYGWEIKRKYTKREMDAAPLLRLRIVRAFEPAGEECGTVYDESKACPACGSGAEQVGSLVLRRSSIPRSADICRTIGGEVVVSSRLAEVFTSRGITGAQFLPIRFNRSSKAMGGDDWMQMRVTNATTQLAPQTVFGVDPFDHDMKGAFRCSAGDLVGLNVLSEVYVHPNAVGGQDLALTSQFIGIRRGLLRPERIVLGSQALRRAVMEAKLRGFAFEIAHTVP